MASHSKVGNVVITQLVKINIHPDNGMLFVITLHYNVRAVKFTGILGS